MRVSEKGGKAGWRLGGGEEEEKIPPMDAVLRTSGEKRLSGFQVRYMYIYMLGSEPDELRNHVLGAQYNENLFLNHSSHLSSGAAHTPSSCS